MVDGRAKARRQVGAGVIICRRECDSRRCFRGIDARKESDEEVAILRRGVSGEEPHEFVGLALGEELRQGAELLGVVGFGEQAEGFDDGHASALRIFDHMVEAVAVVGVDHAAEGLHARVEPVGDEAVAVAVVVEGFPALGRKTERAGVVHQIAGASQHIGAAEGDIVSRSMPMII